MIAKNSTIDRNSYPAYPVKADQPGPVTFRVSLHPYLAYDAAAATRAGLMASEGPLVLRTALRGNGSAFTLDNAQVVVARLGPSADSRADMVRLWNPSDRPQVVWIRWGTAGAHGISLSSPGEEKGAPVTESIAVPAFGRATLRVERLSRP